MKTYEKPDLQIEEQLAEGVFMASGSSTAQTVSHELTVEEAGNKYSKRSKYTLYVTNLTDSTLTGWQVTLQASEGTITEPICYGGELAIVSFTGSQIVLQGTERSSLIGGERKGFCLQVLFEGNSLNLA